MTSIWSGDPSPTRTNTGDAPTRPYLHRSLDGFIIIFVRPQWVEISVVVIHVASVEFGNSMSILSMSKGK